MPLSLYGHEPRDLSWQTATASVPVVGLHDLNQSVDEVKGTMLRVARQADELRSECRDVLLERAIGGLHLLVHNYEYMSATSQCVRI